MEIGNIYHEDGIEFSLVRRYKEKQKARNVAKKITNSGYYGRVKHFYKGGKVLFYGVIMSTKPKTSIKSEYNDDPYSDDPIYDIKMDFKTAKQRMSTMDLGYIHCDQKIKKTKLNLTKGRSCHYNVDFNMVYIGTKFIVNFDRKLARADIVHELIHACGLKHRSHGHSIGYYSRVDRDELTPKVMKKIGWKPPTKQDWLDYAKEVSEEIFYEKQENAKYIIYCPKCDYKTYRQKRSKVIKNIKFYSCPRCKHKGLKVKTI